MSAIEKVKEMENNLRDYHELLEQLIDIEMIYDELNWVDISKPHHIEIELPRVIREVEAKLVEIKYKLERIG